MFRRNAPTYVYFIYFMLAVTPFCLVLGVLEGFELTVLLLSIFSLGGLITIAVIDIPKKEEWPLARRFMVMVAVFVLSFVGFLVFMQLYFG